MLRHNKKLCVLSEEQERPLFSVQNTVIQCELDHPLLNYIINTLSLGPKNAVLDKFNPREVLAEVDGLLQYCESKNVDRDTVTAINVRTLNYIKKYKKLKESRNIKLTKQYLKEHDLLAVPFDKGIGICVMKTTDYHAKLNSILQLPQFKKTSPARKNAKQPVLKEEHRIMEILKKMKLEGKINESLYEKIRPVGSQPPSLYGLAKVHKNNIPVRPVLSMPGSVYHKIGNQVAEWLSVVPECKINSSTKSISDKLSDICLNEDEEIISFDVVSLYTNVPVLESINVCADLLFREGIEQPPIDKETFVELAKISSCNVIMATHDGYYEQIDGLAMGSPPAPHLANGWMSQYDEEIRGEAKIFARYMDDIFRDIKSAEVDQKLVEINGFHPKLSFTIEREIGGRLAFLDMQLIHQGGRITSTWFSKPTDTGLILNYHALAPRRYKRSVVSGFVHRIFRACSTWSHFHASLEKAKQILEHNQYPPSFYNPIIHHTLGDILVKEDQGTTATRPSTMNASADDTEIPKRPIFIQYRGKFTEDFARSLHMCKAPCSVIMTMRKLKTVLPSLKTQVEKPLKSGVVYIFQCASCPAAYVGQTGRHLATRVKEHSKAPSPVAEHVKSCGSSITMADVSILERSSHEVKRKTLEALCIQELDPSLNVQEDFRNRTLTIKFY